MPLNLNSSELTEIWSLIALLKCQNLQKSNLCLHGQTILIFLFFEIDLVTRSLCYAGSQGDVLLTQDDGNPVLLTLRENVPANSGGDICQNWH